MDVFSEPKHGIKQIRTRFRISKMAEFNLADPQKSSTLQNNDSATAETYPGNVRETQIVRNLRRSNRLTNNPF